MLLVDIPGHLILIHPNIPKPLFGLNPRTLMGQQWWDLRRHIAYGRYKNHCWACGVHKKDAKVHQWLEAHECYRIDYHDGTATFIGVSALCYLCHNYIHSGRLEWLYQTKQISKTHYHRILEHGNQVLKEHHVSFSKHPASGSHIVPMVHNPFIVQESLHLPSATWIEWRLIIGSVEYCTPYLNEEECLRKYTGKEYPE